MSIRVLVVDDSPIMRGLISRALDQDPDIDVVGTAGDPYEARQAIKSLNPDVITLDVEMPRMNGIEFLEKIMRLRPTPVIMVSTLTHKGADAAIKAMSLGAIDCLGKPDRGNAREVFAKLPGLVKVASRAKVRPLGEGGSVKACPDTFEPNEKIVAIGASTGGVEALTDVLSGFPENCPPTVIVQHMPALFTGSFAKRLNTLCAAKVEEATDGAPLEVGRVYLAPGGATHLSIVGKGSFSCRLRADELVSGHRPSVDVLFNSVAEKIGRRAVGVILTGMGKDGAAGLLAIRETGAVTIGQDEGSCVIYGMPRVAFEMKAVQRQYPLSRITPAIMRACDRNAKAEAAA
ncbi:Chemotaxis response regulator protein-glutamate methylesterase CheB [hydrothermal vent metagenome]|uniref:protein-glutamate methylesterase n=1 Tax=hydrothermal vent metagenome TaxID=652676 RepID=A0A3B0SSZ7_9ZZZZ